MRLERLEISGFKSFSDRSELAFDQGVTAIWGACKWITSYDLASKAAFKARKNPRILPSPGNKAISAGGVSFGGNRCKLSGHARASGAGSARCTDRWSHPGQGSDAVFEVGSCQRSPWAPWGRGFRWETRNSTGTSRPYRLRLGSRRNRSREEQSNPPGRQAPASPSLMVPVAAPVTMASTAKEQSLKLVHWSYGGAVSMTPESGSRDLSAVPAPIVGSPDDPDRRPLGLIKRLGQELDDAVSNIAIGRATHHRPRLRRGRRSRFAHWPGQHRQLLRNHGWSSIHPGRCQRAGRGSLEPSTFTDTTQMPTPSFIFMLITR